MSATRIRKRAGGIKTSEATPEMKDLAMDFYSYNKEKNTNERLGKKARGSLYSMMKEAKLPSFTFSSKLDGKIVSLDVQIGAKETTSINTDKLLEIVGQEKFLEIVSASKTAVESAVGSDIVMQVLETKPGTENVNVKPAK